MILYILRDIDPIGGFFAAQGFKPDPLQERATVVEVRAVEDFPEDLWAAVLAGELPVDVDGSNDSTWLQWWDQATPVWSRADSLNATSETGA